MGGGVRNDWWAQPNGCLVGLGRFEDEVNSGGGVKNMLGKKLFRKTKTAERAEGTRHEPKKGH